MSVRVLTELLDPMSFGELALGLTVAMLLNQVLFGPLNQGSMRFYAPAHEAGEIDSYRQGLRRLVGGATLASVLIAIALLAGLLAAERTQWIALAVAAFVFSILSGYNAILNGVQNAARQRAVVALHQGAASWLRLLAAAALIVWFGGSSANALYGYALAMVFVLVSQWYFFRRIMPPQTAQETGEKSWERRILAYSWPFGAWGVFYWAHSVSDRWALEFFATTTDVGLFAVLYQIGFYPISLATGMAVQFLAPILFQRAGDASDSVRAAGATRLGWRLTALALVLTVVAFIIVYLLHDLLFALLVAAEYRTVSHLLPWMVLAGGLFAAGQTIALNLMSLMKTREMLSLKIGTSLVGVGLNVAAGYWYGVSGVVFAGIASAGIYLLWAMYLAGRPKPAMNAELPS